MTADVPLRQSRHHRLRKVSTTFPSSAMHRGPHLWSAVAGNANVVIGVHFAIDNADPANAALVVRFVQCDVGRVLVADPHDLPSLLCELGWE